MSGRPRTMPTEPNHAGASKPRPRRRRAGGRLPLVLVAALLLGSAGCAPLIPESAFLDLASRIALDPTKTCEWLKVVFGVPHLQTVADPGEAGMEFVEAYVTNASGHELRVWYVPAEESRGTIVLSNGAVGEIACYLLITKTLHDRGWSFVMYDFQGFGGSGGQPDLGSLYGDLDAVLDWTFENTGAGQVTLMGVSIGTIPAVAHAANRPEAVNALVLDGLISLRTETERFSFLLGGHPERYYGLFDDELRLQLQIAHVTQPILAIVYGRDEYATSAHVPGILAFSPAPATILEFPDLPHARGPYLGTERYFEVLTEFLESVWSADANH